LALRERRVGGRSLLTVKTSGSTVGGLSQRGEWEVPKPRGRIDFSRVVDEPALAAALQDWAPRLRAVFRTDFVRRAMVVEHAGARIELAFDDGHIGVGSGRRVRRERLLEVELELLDGPVDALLDLAHTLVLGPEGQTAGALHLHPEPRSKAERGYALFAGQAAMPRRAAPLELARDMTVREAFQAASLACLTHLQANEAESRALAHLPPAAAPLPDPEFVHQLRVALRRLRTGLRLFRERAAALRLAYGRDDLSPPQYDLALIAPQLTGVAATEVMAGPEQNASPQSPSMLMSPQIFWGVLIVAVLVLLTLVVRLLRKSDVQSTPAT